ncbi:MAG: hypothetical protein DMF49_07570 [Acidobacteria bacterium]|nr:MAG: hypothetical protein DMF49_07570 [Acidobacteriota bacterium]
MPRRRNRSSRIQKAAKTAIAAIRNLANSIEDLGAAIPAAVAAGRNQMRGRGGTRRRRRLSAKAKAFLKLQGQYLGLMRHLPQRQRAKVKALKAKKGYPAAIKEAVRLRVR